MTLGTRNPLLARGKLTPPQLEGLRSGITYTTDYDAIAGANWVLEGTPEDLALKRRIFARAEAIAPPDALLTSNASSIPAAKIFAGLRRPAAVGAGDRVSRLWRVRPHGRGARGCHGVWRAARAGLFDNGLTR